MNMLDIRLWLATEAGLFVSIIGVFLAMAALLVVIKPGTRIVRVGVCLLSGAIVVLLVANLFDMKRNYVDIPTVESLDVKLAKSVLIQAGIEPDDILISGYAGVSVSENNSEVKTQSRSGVNRLDSGSISIELACIPYEAQINSLDNPDTSGDSQVTFSEPQTNVTASGLSLIINDCQYFYDGFYHQMPESGLSYSFVEYDQGISGHFSYSRELTDIEYEDWGHGGKILDANGNELDIDASFYATTDGVFAVELPKDMPSGTYTYLLYLFVHDEYCEARIPFTW